MVCCLVEWIVCCLSEWIVCLYEIDLDPHVVWTPCFMIFRPFVGLPVMYIPNTYLLCMSPTLARESIAILQNEFVQDTVWSE